jgi:lauroyl/myristoyl acyltransferase|tara:strand:+ start:38 stop:421 length:384 start_codon:yes stop_codon:yes gene_type:complete
MQQALIGILLVLGIASYWLYTENQTLTENNMKLEFAVEEQKQTMAIMKEQYEKQGESLMNMSRMNAQIEKEKAEYLAIFSRHNLDLLATKKPGLIESRFNNASEAVMEGLEDDTEALYSIDNPTTND